MSSVSVYLLFAIVAVTVFVQCSAQNFPAQEDDTNLCKENANGREFVDARKEKPNDCKAHCKYTDGETEEIEVINSKDGQLCCDTGVMFTGVFVQCCAQYFPPKEDDTKLCKENANGRKFVDARKDKPHNWKVSCKYTVGETEEIEVINSKDGQQCCDTGVMYTGRCKDGVCPPGSVMG